MQVPGPCLQHFWFWNPFSPGGSESGRGEGDPLSWFAQDLLSLGTESPAAQEVPLPLANPSCGSPCRRSPSAHHRLGWLGGRGAGEGLVFCEDSLLCREREREAPSHRSSQGWAGLGGAV